jgi:hypothetical protein
MNIKQAAKARQAIMNILVGHKVPPKVKAALEAAHDALREHETHARKLKAQQEIRKMEQE